jgi:uncharacterized membrane protein
MIAIKESVGLPDGGIFPLIIVVDVLVANIWMAVLLFFAGRERRMDAAIHADRTTLDDVRQRVEAYEAEVARPTTLADLLIITAIGVGTTALSWALAESGWLPTFAVVSPFTWVVVIATTVALILSFTRLRGLEGAGASKVGSVFLYLLVASIGAHAEFSKVGDAPALLAVGAVWMAIHASIMLLVRWKLRAPIFFMAVGSKANVGGAASAPVVAAAFHPALAPVGVLLAILGYVLGTYAGLLCALLLEGVYGLVG